MNPERSRLAACLVPILRAWPLAALLTLAAGCKTVDPLAPALRGEVREGMTMTEVRQRMGSPTYYEQGPEGSSVETYEALQTIFGSYGVPDREEAIEIRQFSVRYDASGQATRTLYHRGVLEGFTMLYSRSVGPEITPEKMAQVRSGRSTRADVERLFGPPSLARLDLAGGVRLEWIYDYIEASAVTPGQVYRSVEIVLNEADVVTSVKTVDRVMPSWRR